MHFWLKLCALKFNELRMILYTELNLLNHLAAAERARSWLNGCGRIPTRREKALEEIGLSLSLG